MPDSEKTSSNPPKQLLALPSPSEAADQSLEAGGSIYRFDALGPMVVNSDGTLSRIANWQEMTQPERERIVRVLGKRNQIRLLNEERKAEEAGAGGEKLSIALGTHEQ
ncbi:hypothetical protein CALVIDRAFT_536207 [Calocera viscosa TUFC12733]|uniref:Fungal-type protein kinase domain-containing protein n=1 Tax=Calocera viscosa (strain TUFC12733) TaxID=1330018 RepID=A0A167NEB8_CALVF|nr:hypothetical protein CALVIDRAFT_536207 [Calocera viscosa TUFC12733]